MTNPEFRSFMIETFRKTLFEAGLTFYNEKLGVSSKPGDQTSMKAPFLEALSDLSASLAQEAMDLLEKAGIKTENDLLARQKEVVKILGEFEVSLRKQLTKLDEKAGNA